MTKQNQDELKICCECIGDEFLSGEVKKQGISSRCSYCDRTAESLILSILTQKIYGVMNRDFVFSRSYPQEKLDFLLHWANMWTRPGKSPTRVIEEIAGISEDIAEGICAYLSALPENQDREIERDENPFSDDARYIERKPNDGGFHEPWVRFRREIQSRKRFFGTTAECVLHKIFDDLAAHKTIDGQRAVREISPQHNERFVWRARSASSAEEVVAIRKHPTSQIGPPPSRKARGGRMNPPGIPVFYGATDKCTAISEIRPVVGSFVVVGKFELLHPVRVLDLDLLTDVHVDLSHFDPDYSVHKARAEFFRRLVREIGIPVLPEDEALDYLPYQAMADFLANELNPNLDGVLFRSSQAGGSGRNLVMFNHASNVAPIDPSSPPEEFHMSSADPNDDENLSWKLHIVPPAGSETSNVPLTAETPVGNDSATENYALRLDLGSVEVCQIKSVKYGIDPVRIKRHRTVDRR